MSCLIGNRLPEKTLDDVECHVDTRGYASGRDDTVVDRPGFTFDRYPERFEEVKGPPVGRGTPTIQEPTLGKEESASAHRRCPPRCCSHPVDPVERLGIVEQRPRTKPTRDDQKIDRWRVGKAVMWDDSTSTWSKTRMPTFHVSMNHLLLNPSSGMLFGPKLFWDDKCDYAFVEGMVVRVLQFNEHFVRTGGKTHQDDWVTTRICPAP